MRKKINIFSLTCFLIIMQAIVCAQDDIRTLESLKAPSMPSANIIGIQTIDINSPKSLKELEAAILTNYVDENQSLIVPNNYALEINPFMLNPRRNFDYLDYCTEDWKKNLWQNLSLSVSSTTKYAINDSLSSNAMGFGIRSVLYNGKVRPDLDTSFRNALVNNIMLLDLKNYVREAVNHLPKTLTTKKEIKEFIIDYLLKTEEYKYSEEPVQFTLEFIFNKLPNEIDKENLDNLLIEVIDSNMMETSLKELYSILKKIKDSNYRYGLRVELDYAQALSFPTNSFDYSISPRWGLWTNVSYRPASLKDGSKIPWNFEFIGLARIIKNNDDFINKYTPADTSFQTGTIFDLGIKAAYDYKNFTVDVEYIHRFNRNKIIKTIDGEEYSRTENFDTHKYLLSINYNISDNIALSYNIGQGFDSAFSDGGNLISGLSLNFGFGKIKADDLIKKKSE